MNDNFRLLPEQASTMAPRVDALFWFIAAVSAFFIVLVALLLLTFAVRYRRRSKAKVRCRKLDLRARRCECPRELMVVPGRERRRIGKEDTHDE